MFLTITNPIITEDSTMLDRLKLGSSTLLMGMLIVFAMLTIIFIAMVIMQKCFTRKKSDKKEAVKDVAPKAVEEPVAVVPAAAPEASDDAATVAAIMAAISAYTGKSVTSFRVVSFKRRH